MKTYICTLIIAVILGSFGLQSCNNKDNPADPQKSMDDLVVPDGFVFETTKEVTLAIQMPGTVNFSDMRSRFDVYSADPSADGKLITSGSFDATGSYSGSIVVPSTLTDGSHRKHRLKRRRGDH